MNYTQERNEIYLEYILKTLENKEEIEKLEEQRDLALYKAKSQFEKEFKQLENSYFIKIRQFEEQSRKALYMRQEKVVNLDRKYKEIQDEEALKEYRENEAFLKAERDRLNAEGHALWLKANGDSK